MYCQLTMIKYVYNMSSDRRLRIARCCRIESRSLDRRVIREEVLRHMEPMVARV